MEIDYTELKNRTILTRSQKKKLKEMIDEEKNSGKKNEELKKFRDDINQFIILKSQKHYKNILSSPQSNQNTGSNASGMNFLIHFDETQSNEDEDEDSDYNMDDDKILNELKELDMKQDEIDKILESNRQINEINKTHISDRIKVLKMDIPIEIKAQIIKKVELLEKGGNNDYRKIEEWVSKILKVPFGKYCEMPVSLKDGNKKVGDFLNNFKKTLDEEVYGHIHVKETLMELMAKWISHPPTKGHCIAIVGQAGTGKTSLFRGLSKALDRPLCSFSLAGMSDESYLSGFSFTYEGSDYGRITRMLINAQCMNPIIYMDELDKIDTNNRGMAVMNKLIEITDFSQNHEFEDLYFGDIKMDLSKCLFIFSLNDINLIDPILRDRLEVIHVNGFNKNDKLKILRDYIIPVELKELNMEGKIIFPDYVLDYIINKVSENEKGVRNIKRNVQMICRKLNTMQFTKNLEYNKFDINYPLTLTRSMINILLNKVEEDKPFLSMYM